MCSVTGHSSSVTDWLIYFRRNNLPQTNDTSLTQKRIFTCHMVMARPSHKDQQLRIRVCSLGGVPVFQCFCLLQEPQLQHPPWHLQMSHRDRLEHQVGSWAPSSQNTHILDVSQGLSSHIWARRRSQVQSVSLFLQDIVHHVFFTAGFSHDLHAY